MILFEIPGIRVLPPHVHCLSHAYGAFPNSLAESSGSLIFVTSLFVFFFAYFNVFSVSCYAFKIAAALGSPWNYTAPASPFPILQTASCQVPPYSGKDHERPASRGSRHQQMRISLHFVL